MCATSFGCLFSSFRIRSYQTVIEEATPPGRTETSSPPTPQTFSNCLRNKVFGEMKVVSASNRRWCLENKMCATPSGKFVLFALSRFHCRPNTPSPQPQMFKYVTWLTTLFLMRPVGLVTHVSGANCFCGRLVGASLSLSERSTALASLLQPRDQRVEHISQATITHAAELTDVLFGIKTAGAFSIIVQGTFLSSTGWPNLSRLHT